MKASRYALVPVLALLAGAATALAAVRSPLDRLPLHFEESAAGSGVYSARSAGYRARILPGAVWLSGMESAVCLEWQDASAGAAIAAEEPLPGVSHYFLGSDPAAWRTGVRHYRRLRARGLYPGVEVVYYGAARRLEFDVIVSPGAEPDRARFRVRGPAGLRVNGDGELEIGGGEAVFRLLAPRVYQTAAGRRRPLSGRYVLQGDGVVGFEVDGRDPSLPLVIDPVLAYSTLVGGSDIDSVHAVAADPQGNVYATGETHSGDFPSHSLRAVPGTAEVPGNVFVMKVNAQGTGIMYSAVFGGSRRDCANDIAVTGDGFANVAGFTESKDFPVSATAPQKTIGDTKDVAGDAFVTRLTPAGNVLWYSTYLGGKSLDRAHGIAVASNGEIVVAGETDSANFPTTPGAFRTALASDMGTDGFVTRLVGTGTQVRYSTLLGGRSNDIVYDLALGPDGNPFVTGATMSPDFPTTAGALRTAYLGAAEQLFTSEAFAAKLKADGAGLEFSSFLGGGRDDFGRSIGLDSFSHVYVAGATNSTDFPVTAGALQAQHADGGADYDAFVLKLDRSGARLGWATYLGGGRTDLANALAVAPSTGVVTVAGESDSGDLRSSGGPCETLLPNGGRDAFVARLTAGGDALAYLAYLGGAGADRALGVAVDSAGNAYAGGQTSGGAFPVSAGAVRTQGVSIEGFLAKLSEGSVSTGPCISASGIVNAASYRSGTVSPGEIVVLFGRGIGPPQLAGGQLTPDNLYFTKELAGTKVIFDDTPGALIYAYQTQVSAIVPYSVAGRTSTRIRVEYAGQRGNAVDMPVAASMPGIFALDATGQGQGAVLHPDYSVNGPANPAARGGVVSLYTTGEGQSDPPGQDGKLAIGTYPKPVLPVSVRVGGAEAQLQYYGAAPGLVAGVMQVNVWIPAGIAPGNAVPVLLKVGDRVSQPGITIAVK